MSIGFAGLTICRACRRQMRVVVYGAAISVGGTVPHIRGFALTEALRIEVEADCRGGYSTTGPIV